MELDSGTRLVANGTRVGEIFTAAGAAFQKIGELAMILYGNKASRKSVPGKTEEKVRHAVRKFATEIESITGDIRKKTGDQIKSELKRKNEEERAQAAEMGGPSTSKQRRSQNKPTHFSPPRDELNGSLTDAERIMAQADAERMAILAGIPSGTDDSFPEEGAIVEEEIITTEPEDGSVSDSGPVRGIGVAGSGESSSGEDEHVDPNRAKKRSKKRKMKRGGGNFLIEGLRVEDEDTEEDQIQHHALMHEPHLAVAFDDCVVEEVHVTEEEVVHDGLELQFAVTEEEVFAS